jgi:CubicO group peptidase (beta-lactamase class C family)
VLRPAARKITLRHLLTHTAGLSYDNWNPRTRGYLEATGTPLIGSGKRAALSTPLAFEPGTDWEYSIGIDFAGLAVEAISGLSLDAYLRAHVTGPLGMHDTGFLPDAAQFARLASLQQRAPDGTLAALPMESPPSPPEFFGGGGGLYGTAPDYLRFLRMLLAGGTLDGVRVLRPETVALMGENHIGELAVRTLRTARPLNSNDFELGPGQKWGLSFLIDTAPGPNGRSAGSLAWAGLCNTYYWVDPRQGVAGLLMTQVLPFGDPAVLDLFGLVERGAYASLGLRP